MGDSLLKDPSAFSDAAVQPVYPPQTVLIRWLDELLLLDAWDPHGRGLRTPPSLISEALAHFDLQFQVSDYRLAIRERVDGVPRLLFLGISALRFVEDGRVLELVDISLERGGYSHSSSRNSRRSRQDPAVGQSNKQPFILEQSSEMPKAASSPASYQTASIFDSGTGALSKLSSPPLQTPSLPHKISNKSSLTLVEKRHEPNASTYIYVHPKFGALFAHIAAKPNEDEDPRQPELKALDLESSDPFHSPMLSPLRGGFHSRSSSGVSSPSRLRNITSQDDNGDLWLGAEGLVEWQREQQNKESDSRQQHRNRSRLRAAAPTETKLTVQLRIKHHERVRETTFS
ncbi:MAG: hypothetical protein CYPHOPRED_005785 [Cyphobasidiales sp. Tagirdzhanova-0007]|nr:MAG: hypothetical protein CYPHOPRED_005785 [Cyphobasidiales sp. Tagirdzhanova-0007]